MKRLRVSKVLLLLLGVLAVGAQAGAATFADFGGERHQHQRSGVVGVRKTTPPVPEAETWAMMGVGLTVLGVLARRHMVKK